jgi:ankyrin repeat protein
MSDEPEPFRGPCADDPRGEELIDVLADVVLAGFAPELASCRFLCNETFQIRERGAVADVLKNGLEASGASAVRALRRNSWGTTQLMRAVGEGNEQQVRLLLALGAPINSLDPFGQSALIKAVAGGHIEITNLLLDSGADINMSDRPVGLFCTHSVTPLITAVVKATDPGGASSNDEAMVRLLLDRHADVTVRRGIGPALSHARFFEVYWQSIRSQKIVELLKEYGATE